jgi:hypothetical protein
MAEESVGPAELSLLRRLAQVGGRYTFRPDGEDQLAQRAFEEGIIADVRSLHAKGLVHLDSAASEYGMRGQLHRLIALTVELTDAGRRVLSR